MTKKTPLPNLSKTVPDDVRDAFNGAIKAMGIDTPAPVVKKPVIRIKPHEGALYLAIDVGMSGACVGYVWEDGKWSYECLLNNEEREDIVKKLKQYKEVYIIIEDVHSRPTDGKKSAFTFGRSLGWWDGVFSALCLTHITRVDPKVWSKAIGFNSIPKEPYVERKRRLKAHCLQTLGDKDGKYEGIKITLTNCDALLMGQYVKTIYG